MLDAAKIRKHERILSAPVGENGCPNIPVRYHRTCRSTFTHRKDLLKLSGEHEKKDPSPSEPRRSSRDPSDGESIILPKHCIFCKKKINTSRSQQQGKNSQLHGIQGGRKGKEECNASCRTVY